MDILILLIFISAVFFAGALIAFLRSVRGGAYDTVEQASLLPLSRDTKERGRAHDERVL